MEDGSKIPFHAAKYDAIILNILLVRNLKYYKNESN